MTAIGAERARARTIGRLPLVQHAWVAVFLALAALPPLLFADSYLMGVFVVIAIYGIVVVSLDLLMGYGGLLSFGHNGFFALGAYVMGVLAARLGIPLPIGMAAAVLVNLGLAFVIGVATLRMKEYYFAVATLGFGVIVIQVLGGLPELTGGWSGLTGVPRLSVFGFSLVADLHFYIVAVVGLLASLAVARNLVGSRFGRAIRAFGNDEVASEMLGIAVARHKIQLFMITSVFASLAGSLFGLFMRVVTPANFDIPVMVEMVLMLFLGGKETLWGAVIGATILRILPEVMGSFQDYKTLPQGLVFILILLFLPKGLAGVGRDVWRRARGLSGERRGATPEWRAERVASGEQIGSRSGERLQPGAEGTGAEPLATPALPLAARASASPTLLEASHLSKRFKGLRAVNDLSFGVQRGQLKAIIGPNGAGKTTVFNLLTGVIPPDSGRVVLDGKDVTLASPHDVARLGMGRTFQTPRLFASMSVLENVMVGHHTRLKTGLAGSAFPLPRNRAEERWVMESSHALLELVGLDRRALLRADQLPFGERRLLEIARALALQPLLLLLDEPAAGLNEAEKDRLGELLRRLQQGGLTLLLVEHDMRLVMGIADEVLVMNHGEKIAEGTPSQVQRDEGVLSAYLGEETVSAAG
jgi:branched-chain amino acid transport system permease protein